MTYEVILTSRAKLQIAKAALWWAKQHSADQAAAWLLAAEATIAKLATRPEQFAVAHENDLFDFTVRQLTFGLGTKPTHRALFKVRNSRVYVLAVRHLAQRAVTPKDL